MKTNNLIILATILFVSIIISIFYNIGPKKEGIIPQRLVDVTTILNDDSLTADQQIQMLQIIGIGDPFYANVINNSRMSNNDKIKALKTQLNII